MPGSTITVNGVIREFPGGTVYDLLVTLGLDPDRRGLAVAVNGEVVSRTRWREVPLKPNDHVEIVTAVAGG